MALTSTPNAYAAVMSTAAMGVGAVLGDLLGAARGKTGLGPLTLATT